MICQTLKWAGLCLGFIISVTTGPVLCPGSVLMGSVCAGLSVGEPMVNTGGLPREACACSRTLPHFSIQGTAKIFVWRNCACNTQSCGYGVMARPGDLTRDALEPVVRDMKRKPAELRITLASVRCWQTDPPKKRKNTRTCVVVSRKCRWPSMVTRRAGFVTGSGPG